jgi:hypothetical protein
MCSTVVGTYTIPSPITCIGTYEFSNKVHTIVRVGSRSIIFSEKLDYLNY